jgi:hypothetical protein
MYFSVRCAGSLVIAFTYNPAVTNNNRTYGRIGASATKSLARQFQSPAHILNINFLHFLNSFDNSSF